jgi:NAD(P)-dependent dehydrogenase (short-subunit alcohol dehydrogenase family)
MDTDTAETTVEKVKPMIAGMQAVPRAGETDDIANAAVYLGSAEAGFVNGVDIVIDGGLIWGRRYSETSKGGGTWSTLFD